ncbi:hypothetical protein K4K51_007346 [Colletotrichum sp. SAR 10_75]|nr:hypothetical protein K4K51_007346 [Colletotrichum sp. SAR 10_75]
MRLRKNSQPGRELAGYEKEIIYENLSRDDTCKKAERKESTARLRTNVAFIPHVAVWFAGIHHTISLPLVSAKLSRDVLQLHRHPYNKKRLVKIYGGSHLVKRIEGKQSVEMGRLSVHLTSKRALVNVQSPPTTCQRAPPPSDSRT